MKDYVASQVDYNINVVMGELVSLKNSGCISDSKYDELWNLLDYCSMACFDSIQNNND